MRAFFLNKPGETDVKEIEKPSPDNGEILLKVSYVGFCGGDLNGYRGLFELQEYPVVIGHELGATIEKIGVGVPEHLKSGMKVTVFPYQNCGVCLSCRKRRFNACADNKTMGVRRPGAMTRYITVPWEKVYASNSLSLKELALVEPLSVGFHAASRGKITAADTVAVIGCGIVGMGALAAAVNRGANVIAVDIDDTKMAIAKKAGANHVINTLKQDLHKSLQEITNGDGPDVIIEAVGNIHTYKAAVDEVAFTGRVVYIGYAKQPVAYNTGEFVKKEIEIYGSRNCNDEFTDVIEYLEKGTFPVDDVITRMVTLDDAGEALKNWSDNPGSITKIMVNLENE